MRTWQLGDVSATRIEESLGFSKAPTDFFTDFDPAVFDLHMDWMVPLHYNPEKNRIITSVHSWLIRTPRHTILLDACGGNHKNRPWNPRFHNLDTPFIENLAQAGVRPEDIDIVLCTHLHTDHAGWNTKLENGHWVPTFPNAKYLFSKKENELSRSKNEGVRATVYRDSVLPVIEAQQAVLLDDGVFQIDDHLLVEPSPGHTAGHITLQAGTADNQGIFCGDAIHHPIQVYEPDWSTKFCEDPALARATRIRMLAHCAEQRATLFPTHFAQPHVAAIMRRGEKFAPAFVPPTR